MELKTAPSFFPSQQIYKGTSPVCNGIEAPAITIQANDNENQANWGWKSDINVTDIVYGKCGQAVNIKECIQNQTYSLSEILSKGELGAVRKMSLVNPELWTEDFTSAKHGRFYTLKFNEVIGPDYLQDFIFLHFNPTLKYSIWLHDENFFLLNENFFALPSIFRKFDPPTSSVVPPTKVLFYLVLHEHHQLSLPGSLCAEDPEYKFEPCVKDSLAKKVRLSFFSFCI